MIPRDLHDEIEIPSQPIIGCLQLQVQLLLLGPTGCDNVHCILQSGAVQCIYIPSRGRDRPLPPGGTKSQATALSTRSEEWVASTTMVGPCHISAKLWHLVNPCGPLHPSFVPWRMDGWMDGNTMRHPPTSPNTAPANQKWMSWLIRVAYETSSKTWSTMREATLVTIQPHQIPQLLYSLLLRSLLLHSLLYYSLLLYSVLLYSLLFSSPLFSTPPWPSLLFRAPLFSTPLFSTPVPSRRKSTDGTVWQLCRIYFDPKGTWSQQASSAFNSFKNWKTKGPSKVWVARIFEILKLVPKKHLQ